MIKKLFHGLLAVAFAFMLSLPTQAAAAVDQATVDQVDSIKLTVLAIIALFTAIVTAGLGVRMYSKGGKRAVRAM